MNEMDSHIKVVAILGIIFGVLEALLGVALFFLIAGAGVISGEGEAMFVTGTVGVFVGGLLVILGLPSIIAGVGLLKHQNWARILMLVVAALSVFNVPFGTLFAIYAFWVLVNDRTRPLFAT